MKTKAVRLYGKDDLRLEEFELPALGDDEILASVVSDSLCMSSYKATIQGAAHKRVPDDVAEHPVIIGHECCGVIQEVGKNWRGRFQPGQKFTIQPALNYHGSLASPGYSYPYIGGDATTIVIPHEVMETGSLLPFDGDAFFYGSLSEPMSCIIGAFHAAYHTTNGVYEHRMGIVEGGNLAVLAGVGPMGLGAISYALNCDRRPGRIVVTDIDDARLARAEQLFPVAEAAKQGIELVFLNTASCGDPVRALLDTTGGKGFDDVFVFAPVRPVVEQGDRILARDGCLNFFAGPTNPEFRAEFNFYNVHYASTHLVGTSGGNTDDMREALRLMETKRVNPAVMITHVGGLDAVIGATMNLPKIPGGKKLIYPHIDLELTALADFEEKGRTDPLFAELDRLVKAHNHLWNAEAERCLLAAKQR